MAFVTRSFVARFFSNSIILESKHVFMNLLSSALVKSAVASGVLFSVSVAFLLRAALTANLAILVCFF